MFRSRPKHARMPRVEPWPHDPDRSGVVFVMGSGRNGTHWLGYILDSHPDIRATVEKVEIFEVVTRMAMVPHERHALISQLIREYRGQRAGTAERWYADKSHPSLWIAEYLADAIPPARFIGILRDPYQAVASMIRHEGVSRWPTIWREFPVPNRFLGIDHAEAERYDRRTTAEKHALRWLSHARRLDELEPILGPRMHRVRYEDIQQRTPDVLEGLRHFLGLDRPFPEPDIRTDSMTKWREVLSPDDIAAIEAITGVPRPE